MKLIQNQRVVRSEFALEVKVDLLHVIRDVTSLLIGDEFSVGYLHPDALNHGFRKSRILQQP